MAAARSAAVSGGAPRERKFEVAAREALRDSQLRRNLTRATGTIREKRAAVTGEMPDWEALREAGRRLKAETMAHLDEHLVQLEASVTARGGVVHWARDAAEANAIVRDIAVGEGAREVVKVKSITTDEIGLNEALAAAGVTAIETDLAELIVQLAHEPSSHILVPAIHKNRAQIRELFLEAMGLSPAELSDEPRELAAAARRFLRERFFRAQVAVSGANFAVAETGSVCVVESEGNGRMCTTLPRTLITVMGIEKVVPTWRAMEVFLQLLPRSSTAERMNPYTSFWSGVRPGDGPQAFHLVLLDNGRSRVLADAAARETLHCIRCSACLNVCPVYARVGGHAYGSVYPGPIGAILTPQLRDSAAADTLPFASTLCGACYEVCPVKIDIPRVLLHLRGKAIEKRRASPSGWRSAEDAAMRAAAYVLTEPRRYERVQRLARASQGVLARDGTISWLPGYLGRWTGTRDLPAVPRRTFREWWEQRW
ncbi:MAG TPA: LutB/LldF family L-lactate oxidation iron-sulfur protein [Trueperaceae bacterium]|nr:LutB/LldF family L-lactate oxidation iron-sulfur protein [Trueperaceae bacterium]